MAALYIWRLYAVHNLYNCTQRLWGEGGIAGQAGTRTDGLAVCISRYQRLAPSLAPTDIRNRPQGVVNRGHC